MHGQRETTRWSHIAIRRPLAVLAFALGALVPGVARAQKPDTARISAARDLLEAWGKKQSLTVDVEHAVADQQSKNTQLPGDFWASLVTELTPDTLGEFLVRIYARHLSAADMDSTAVFLRSSVVNRYSYILASSGQKISNEIEASLGPPVKGAPPPPAVDSVTGRAIHQLFLLMGLQRHLEVTIDSAAREQPDRSKGMPEEFQAEMTHQLLSFLVDSVVAPIYAQKLSNGEVRAARAFFASPAGKHFLVALPAIEREDTAARRSWRAAIREAIAKQVQLRSGAKS